MFCPGVEWNARLGRLVGVATEAARAAKIKCAHCGKMGAALGCYKPQCRRSFHVLCVKASGGELEPKETGEFTALCKNHCAAGKQPAQRHRRRSPAHKQPVATAAAAAIFSGNLVGGTASGAVGGGGAAAAAAGGSSAPQAPSAQAAQDDRNLVQVKAGLLRLLKAPEVQEDAAAKSSVAGLLGTLSFSKAYEGWDLELMAQMLADESYNDASTRLAFLRARHV